MFPCICCVKVLAAGTYVPLYLLCQGAGCWDLCSPVFAVSKVLLCLVCFPGMSTTNYMLHLADQCIAGGLRPRTLAFYAGSFKLFWDGLHGLTSASQFTVVIYFEYLAQNNIHACSMRNHLSVLKHYFALTGPLFFYCSFYIVTLYLQKIQRRRTQQNKTRAKYT